ncbi:hypothetical protein TNCV_2162241 [Trichonephila clavipes]|nr:hypothetical protein TNCV_2162241 [Trichonephila clavipes]
MLSNQFSDLGCRQCAHVADGTPQIHDKHQHHIHVESHIYYLSKQLHSLHHNHKHRPDKLKAAVTLHEAPLVCLMLAPSSICGRNILPLSDPPSIYWSIKTRMGILRGRKRRELGISLHPLNGASFSTPVGFDSCAGIGVVSFLRKKSG